MQRSVDEARNATVVDLIFGFFDDIGGEAEALLVRAFGGGFAADTITNGVNVFGGSFEEFIDFNASVFIFDAGVF